MELYSAFCVISTTPRTTASTTALESTGNFGPIYSNTHVTYVLCTRGDCGSRSQWRYDNSETEGRKDGRHYHVMQHPISSLQHGSLRFVSCGGVSGVLRDVGDTTPLN